MLVQFSVKNYRSLKDKVTLSLSAGTDTEHGDDLINAGGKKRLVPVAAIFGANSSGKSNIIMAMRTMQDMITGFSSQIQEDTKLPYDPFTFADDTRTMPTEFEIIFYYNNVKYAYGFSYDADQILAENLYHWPNGREALIFSRDAGKYVFRENINEQTVLANRTPSNKLYLVSSNEWNLPQTKQAYYWFNEKLLCYEEWNTCDKTVGAIMGLSTHSIGTKVINELILSDLGIANVDVVPNNEHNEKPSVVFTHKTESQHGPEQYELPLECESKGVQRFFSLIGSWLIALEKGGVLFVDDLEMGLHHLLTKKLVKMMQNPQINKNKAQLIFTTHDVMLLDLPLLRRDQIWFSDKGLKTLVTELFSLWDFSVRKGEDIRKGYLQGRYGAVPVHF